jgi:FtsP/CotA-like multicopper oxidase with cupredoxin domain
MISRRAVLELSGLAALGSVLPAASQELPAPDHRLEIAPVTLDLSPRHRVRTIGYNGQVPGPVLRFREGRPVTIEVTNRSDRDEVVHWHGLHIPSAVDGAAEEATLPIAPGASARYTFVPRPAGFRWYHTHTMAMGDLTRGQYGGQHGFLLVEPGQAAAPYDQEVFLALHDWEGHLTGSGDGSMSPRYEASTINGRMMGSGEPLRVRQGQRVLLHVLNSSPTEVHWVALAGHTLRVIALDGNAVPSPQDVPMLRLAPGERVCAITTMDNPGVWTLGEVRRHVHAAGMAMTVEYADRRGTPQWLQPETLLWSYEQFAGAAGSAAAAEQPAVLPLVFGSRFRGHGAMEAWTINGRSYPDTGVAPLMAGGRYRLQFINKTADAHPLHLHRHSFEIRSLGEPVEGGARPAGNPATELHGLIKDVVLVDAMTVATVDFIADNPGDTLLHCHQQDHMDLGFMMLLHYA